jgi:hypothetical protein
MKKLFSLLIGVNLLLVSCVIPEKFTCAINVDNQGTYSVDFKGTLLFWVALEEISKQGKISSGTDGQIKAMFDEWVANDPTIKNMNIGILVVLT